MRLLLTKRFAFEMAHALPGYDGKCANLHGHSYHLEVTVEGQVEGDPQSPKLGMVTDFGTIKHIVQKAVIERFDHALVLPLGQRFFAPTNKPSNLVEVPFQPTTENMLLHFATLITPHLPQGTRLYKIRLSETDSSVAELVL